MISMMNVDSQENLENTSQELKTLENEVRCYFYLHKWHYFYLIMQEINPFQMYVCMYVCA